MFLSIMRHVSPDKKLKMWKWAEYGTFKRSLLIKIRDVDRIYQLEGPSKKIQTYFDAKDPTLEIAVLHVSSRFVPGLQSDNT